MRTWLLSVTIRWLGPTAPSVSGVLSVPSSPTAAKLADNSGEGIDGVAMLAAAKGLFWASMPRASDLLSMGVGGDRRTLFTGLRIGRGFFGTRTGACVCCRANSEKSAESLAVAVPA